MRSKDQIQVECLEVILPHQRCGAAISVGAGKTKLGLMHMNANYTDYAKFLVVAPKLTAIKTWKEEALKHGFEFLLPHITFSTYLSLTKQNFDYDVLYLDECHTLKQSHDAWLSNYKGKIIGLTGTPPKYHYSEKGKLVNKYCPIIYTYITDRAVEDGILNDYSIVVHTMPLSNKRDIPMTTGGRTWLTSEQASYEYWTRRIDAVMTGKEVQIMRIMRMKALQSFMTKERYARFLMENAKVKTLVFADTQKQADRLCVNSYHSENPNSEKNLELFKEGSILKLSSVLQLSESVNIPGLKVGIIMHAYGNERKAYQRIGRLFRLSPTDMSLIHVLCYQGTVDETWVKDALDGFDASKITWEAVKVP